MDGVVYKLALSLVLGAFIGIERQIHADGDRQDGPKTGLGLRTFALMTTMGTIGGFVATQLAALFILSTIGVLLLIVGYYVFDSLRSKDFGITTELALLLSYILGLLLALNIFPVQLIIGITVILVFILSQKERLGSYIKAIKISEMQSFIRYAIIALVILPLLPNTGYLVGNIPYAKEMLMSLNIPVQSILEIELINPFQLWLFVALVTGIDIGGYILEKVVGKSKGWLITSFAGGFVSSTATTQSLAQASKTSKFVNVFIIAAIVANLASFIQHALLIFPLNLILFIKIFPVIVLMVIASGILMYLFKRGENAAEMTVQPESDSPQELFHLYPAIKFAILFVIIKFFSSLALIFFGSNGFFLTIALGAIPGLDAVLVTIAQNAGHTISFQLALFAFIIANAVNLLVKCLLSFTQGKREFGIKFLISSVGMLLTGLAGVVMQLNW